VWGGSPSPTGHYGQLVEELPPSLAVSGGFGLGWSAVRDRHGRAATCGMQADFEETGAGWQPVGAGVTPADQQPTSKIAAVRVAALHRRGGAYSFSHHIQQLSAEIVARLTTVPHDGLHRAHGHRPADTSRPGPAPRARSAPQPATLDQTDRTPPRQPVTPRAHSCSTGHWQQPAPASPAPTSADRPSSGLGQPGIRAALRLPPRAGPGLQLPFPARTRHQPRAFAEIAAAVRAGRELRTWLLNYRRDGTPSSSTSCTCMCG